MEISAFFHQLLEYLNGFFTAALASSLETKILVSDDRSATPLTFSKSRWVSNTQSISFGERLIASSLESSEESFFR